MTNGNEPRRRRRQDSSRRPELDEAEDWLAGYRPSPDERDEPLWRARSDETPRFDESTGPDDGPGPRFGDPPAARVEPPTGRFEPPAPRADQPSPRFDAPPGRQEPPAAPFDVPQRGEARPPRGEARPPRGEAPQPRAEEPVRFDVPTPFDRPGQRPGGPPPGEAPTGGRRRRGGFAEEPERRPAPPPAAPAGPPPMTVQPGPPAAQAGRAPSPRGQQPRRDAEADRTGGWRSSSGGHTGTAGGTGGSGHVGGDPAGPELRPIITPLPEFPPGGAPTTPPPLVPIMQRVAPDTPSRRRPRPFGGGQAAEPPEPGPHDEPGGYPGPETTGARRRFRRDQETTGGFAASGAARVAEPPRTGRPAVGEPPAPVPPPLREPLAGRASVEPPLIEPRAGRAAVEPPLAEPRAGRASVDPATRPHDEPWPGNPVDGPRPGRQVREVDDEPVLPRSRRGGPIDPPTGTGQRMAAEPMTMPGQRPAEAAPGERKRRGSGRRPGGARPADIDQVKAANSVKVKRWVAALSVIGVLILIGSCLAGSYWMIKDDRNGPAGTDRTGASEQTKRDISSQQVDPAPLTEAEVFPAGQVTPVPDEVYQVLKTQAADDCKLAATDDLGALLASMGCTQVVRATLKHPNGQYLITAGIFNLRDQAAAQQTHDGIKPIVDAQKGRFNGLAAGAGTDAIVRASTQLGWNFSGHFLAYCVIARTDGKAFDAADDYPKQIIFDIITTYLIEGVVNARTQAAAQDGAPASSDASQAASG